MKQKSMVEGYVMRMAHLRCPEVKWSYVKI
ncbi:Uncharacterised protein [Roseburia inulinivorans]|uniref:Uncharacterized protein n=1 Tax=Roseburia inulinivorans TaxID=360807 RepID=A0A173W1L5_9FIRM|nr:Uncharacterised protein [Roseburia inulinivorans]